MTPDRRDARKLDMARQCWDESRHREISVKLSEWMGIEPGESSESTFSVRSGLQTRPRAPPYRREPSP